MEAIGEQFEEHFNGEDERESPVEGFQHFLHLLLLFYVLVFYDLVKGGGDERMGARGKVIRKKG